MEIDRINERFEDVLAMKRNIDLEIERMVKHKVPDLVGELLETTSRKFNIEFKRVAEKELNLKLKIEKV